MKHVRPMLYNLGYRWAVEYESFPFHYIKYRYFRTKRDALAWRKGVKPFRVTR